ncbi:hypothetical protein EJ04DRAFT_587796 [Polyplosphaeria fusca]|uniref:Uncharacterized protein n=1 Tax=Polyplosphaeria fusca TaxID=682080 RepID=A0A9P4UZ40_9PLEO|nr:hypothetical protein EJ04DRAFT_587796 [Polyplosphaeria fusca]
MAILTQELPSRALRAVLGDGDAAGPPPRRPVSCTIVHAVTWQEIPLYPGIVESSVQYRWRIVRPITMGYRQAHHMSAAPAMPTALPTRPLEQLRLHTPPDGAKAPILSSSPLDSKSHTRSDVRGFLTWLIEQQSEEDALEYIRTQDVILGQMWTVDDIKQMADRTSVAYTEAIKEPHCLKAGVIRHLRKEFARYKQDVRAKLAEEARTKQAEEARANQAEEARANQAEEAKANQAEETRAQIAAAAGLASLGGGV